MEASWMLRGGPQVPGLVGGSARLMVVGDTHGNLDWIGTISRLAARHGCQGALQVGDFGLWPDQRVWRNEHRLVINDRWLDAVASRAATHNVWWRVIDGNHDANPLARAAYPADSNGVRPIRAGVLDWADRGAVWEWCGLRFGALGGGISIDRAARVEGRSWWPTEVISDDDVDALTTRAGEAGVDVLFCHDSLVSPAGIRELSDPVIAADCRRSQRQIGRAVEAVRPRMLVHGHYHRSDRRTLECGWGDLSIVAVASDEQAGDLYGGSWCVLEVPSLNVLDRSDL